MNYKKFVILLISAFSFWGIERLCHHATDGFAMVNIATPSHKPKENWESPISSEDKAALDSLFNQTFSYLSCGAQCYVFESEDGETVIKFFKYHHMRVIPWLEPLPIMQSWKEKKREKKNREILFHLGSYYLAMTQLPKETALIYTHLTPTQCWKKKLKIRDKIGAMHLVDLDQTDYIVQRKGLLAYQKINEWIRAGSLDLAKKGIQDLLNLVKERIESGIMDKDPDFATNFGFLKNGEPFQLDIGRFYLGERREGLYQEIYRISRPFREWIDIMHPQLLEHFDQVIEGYRNAQI